MSKPQDDIVISRKNLPTSLGLGALVAYWLLLTHFSAPAWAFVAFYVFAGFVILTALCRILTTTQIDLQASFVANASPARDDQGRTRERRFVVKASQIRIHRAAPDILSVSLCDANGKDLYRFKDYTVLAGDELRLTGVRVETDLIIND